MSAAAEHKTTALTWLKRIALGIALSALLLVAGATSFLWWLNSDSGHEWLAGTLSADLDSETFGIDITAIEGDIYGDFTARGLRISDAEGVWLDAPELRIAWSPSALLSRQVHVNKLSGQPVAVSRLPKGGEEGGGGALPVALRADDVDLAVNFEGDSYRLDLTRASYAAGRVRGNLVLENADRTDSVTAAVEAADDGSAFDLKLDVSARKGGLVTGLLGLAPEDSVSANAAASGSFKAWQGTLRAEVPGKLAVTGEGGATGGIWKIKLRQRENAFVPEVLARSLGGAVTADVTVNPHALDNLEVMVDLGGTGLQASLFGTVSLDGGVTIDEGKLSAELDRFETSTVEIADIAAEGHVTLEDGHLTLTDYSAKAGQLVTRGMTFKMLEATGDLRVAEGTVSGGVETATVTLTPPGLEEMRVRAEEGDWSYDIASEGWKVAMSRLEGSDLQASTVAAEGGPKGLKSASGKAVVPSAFLARWHGGALTAGQLDLDITSSGVTASGARLNGTIKGNKLAYESAAIAELLGPAPTISARVLIADGGTVTLENAALDGANLDIDARGKIGGSQLDLKFEGKVGETEKLLGEGAVLTGETAFKGSVQGDAAAPTVKVETALASLDAYGVLLSEPAFSLSLTPQQGEGGGVAGDMKITALSPLGDTEVTSPVSIAGGVVALNAIKISSPGADATGALTWRGDEGMDANLKLVLAPGREETFNLRGEGSADVSFSMRGERMSAGLVLDVQDLRVARPGHFPVRIEMAQGTVTFDKDGKVISYQADLAASNIASGAEKIDTLTVKGDSADSDPLRAELTGYLGNRFDLKLAAKPRQGGVDVTFDAAYGDTLASTREAVVVRWGGEEDLLVDIPGLDLAGGALSAKGALSGEDMKLTLDARGLSMTMVNLARPGSVEAGTVDAIIDFDRSGGTEVGNAKVSFTGLTLPRWRLAAAPDTYDGGITATMQEGTISFDGTIVEAGAEFGKLTGNLPYERLQGRQGYAIRDGAPLEMALTWKGDVAPIWLLARRPEHMLTGQLDGKLTLSGELSDPHFAGDLNLRDGHYEYDPLGLVAEIEVLHVTGTQDHIELSELRANDGEDGKLTGEGRFELSSKLAFPGRLTAEMEDFRVARLDEFRGDASASLVYERTETDATLSGSVKTGPMRVKMPKELPRSVVEIDVIEINGAEELAGLTTQNQPVKNRPTNLSIAVEVPGRFFFEGRGLKSEWQGDLLIAGTSDDPEITGSMNVRDGSFTFGSKTFELTEGLLTFRGGKTIDPDIAVTAVHTTPNLEAQLRISGPSSAPEFALTSTPVLPEDEILARILLGKSVSDLSAFQLAELVVAMDTLRGGGSFDVVGKLRRGLGLDTLSFGRTEGEDENATTVTGGKYLRKNIYLEVETSTASSETATRLKIDLTKNLLVETEVGPRQGSSLKLKWFWDY